MLARINPEATQGKMQVIETVKPSIYFKGQVVFHGEVIVGKAKE